MGFRVKVPKDRTDQQPIKAYCTNPECCEHGANGQKESRYIFTVKQDDVSCPKCGANEVPMIGLLVLIHLLIENKTGPIVGYGGLRYSLACDAKRITLATSTNQEAATGDPEVANCPGCLQAARDSGLIAKPRVFLE